MAIGSNALLSIPSEGVNFLVVRSFPAFADGIGPAGAYALYTLSAVISIFLVRSFIKETKGKELEDIRG